MLLGTILILAGMTSVSLANWTDYHNPYFRVVEAGSNHAWFLLHWGTLEGWCEDIDYNCAVKVTGTPSATTGDPVTRWLDELSKAKTIDIGCGLTFGRGSDRYAEFENCMEVQKSGFTVHWPTVKPNDAFEITPFCKSGDEVCSVELRICFNAADCENNNYQKRRWSKVGDFWDDFLSEFRPSCLYDDDEDDVWECINDEFVDWRDDYMPRTGDYDDLVDQDEDEHGFVVMDYKNDLNDVSDRSYFRRYETLPRTNAKSRDGGESRLSETGSRGWPRTTGRAQIQLIQYGRSAPAAGPGPSGRVNGLHRTLDIQFREDDCRRRTGNAPAVMGIRCRVALNRVRTVQQPFGSHMFIGRLRDHIGRCLWIPASVLS